MELKEFITNTLSEIAQGVADAKPLYKSLGGEINPKKHDSDAKDSYKSITIVNFEVALGQNTSDTNTKGIGVLFGMLSVGGDNVDKKSEQYATKIQFSVPVILP